MPNKDDEDCGCTGSIDLEKTTKNINLNISKQTRKHNLDHIKEQNNKKYKNELDCKIAAIARYKKAYNCEQFCKLESKRLYPKERERNCYDLRKRNNQEYDNRIKKAKCRGEAIVLFGASTKIKNCEQLAKAKADRINKLCLNLENKRFNHMFRSRYLKEKKNNEIVIVTEEDGFKILFHGGSEQFIQTYDKGDKSLWQVNNTHNKDLIGKIKSYNSYKEFLIDYFKSPEIFKFNDNNKKYNAKNLKQILDVVGSFGASERLDFDLEKNFFKGCTSLKEIIIENLSTGEEIQPDYDNYNYEFSGISFDNMVDPLSIRSDLEYPLKKKTDTEAKRSQVKNDENIWIDDVINNPTYRAVLLHLTKGHTSFNQGFIYNLAKNMRPHEFSEAWENNGFPLRIGEKLTLKKMVEDTDFVTGYKGGRLSDREKFYGFRQPWILDLNHLMKIHDQTIKIYCKKYVFKQFPSTKLTYWAIYNENKIHNDVDANFRDDIVFEFDSVSNYYIFLWDWILSSVYNLRDGGGEGRRKPDYNYVPYWEHDGPYFKTPHKFKEYPFDTTTVKRGDKFYVEKKVSNSFRTNWNEVMDFFKNTYYTQDITRDVYKKYWAKDLNFSFDSFSMGVNTFHGCKKLAEVKLTSQKIKLGRTFDNYFSGLENLKIVHLNDNVTYIGKKTFSGCKNLKEVFIPQVKSIGELAFEDCKNLTEYTIEKNVSYIHPTAFNGCDNLNKLIIKTKHPQVFDVRIFNGKNKPKIELIELTDTAFNSPGESMSYYNDVKSNQIDWPTQEHNDWSSYKREKKIYDNRLKFHYEKYLRVDACESVMYYFVQEHWYYTKQVLDKASKDYLLYKKFKSDKFYIKRRVNEKFWDNFNHSLKRIIYPLSKEHANFPEYKLPNGRLKYEEDFYFVTKDRNFTYFNLNRRYEHEGKIYNYYTDLSQLPNYLIKDLSTEKLDGVKTFDLNINPSKLPPNYISLKTINKKYTIIGPGVKLNSASLNLKNYDLNDLNINNNLMSIFNTFKFNTYEIVYDQPPTLPVNYVIKVNRVNKKMIIGPGVNLANADLTDVNLNGIDITNINFKNAIFKNVIAANVKINTKSTNIGHVVFEKNNQKYLLGPGLYFDKFDFSNLNLQSLKLNNCVFRNCNFTSTDLRKATLTNCSFINCNLTDAQINNKTTLKGLKSNALTYNGVNFNNEKKYKIYGKNGNGILIGPKVDLSNQNLSNLDLSGANMTQVIIHKTIINDNTKLPKKVDKSKFIVVKS